MLSRVTVIVEVLLWLQISAKDACSSSSDNTDEMSLLQVSSSKVSSKVNIETDHGYIPGSDGTYAQNYQDKWIAAVARHNGWDKRSGFFLDLGAFHGLQCSNTAFIEKQLGWNGICVEPRPRQGSFDQRGCVLVQRPLADVSGHPVTFVGEPGSQNNHIANRGGSGGVTMDTLNLVDLVRCVNSTQERPAATLSGCTGVPRNMHVPDFINFISLDVEGHGLDVLKGFPFDLVKVGAWVIEQDGNKVNDKEEDKILSKQGYIRAPVQNAGVDKYYIQPQFWHESLAQKDLRSHPAGSNGC